MTIACEFDYVKPATLKEALAAMARDGAMALSGGSDLVAWLRDGAVNPSLVVDLKGLKELRGISFADGVLRIGAGEPFADIIDSPLVRRHAPLLAEMAGMVASVGVRNRATMAGNICSAVPCCDSGPALLVYGATLQVATARGPKAIPISKWFLGPRKTSLPKGAIVTAVDIPAKPHAAAFAKLKRYGGEDLAQASVAALVDADGVWSVAYGSVGPLPLPGPKAAAILTAAGKAPSAEALAAAAAAADAEISPITDIRSSEAYRRLMVGVMVKRAAGLAARRLAGEGPDYGMNIMEETER